ncbi:MAG: hypothetical protein V3U29_00135 [Phycisphaeraceae bacterium]
MTIALLWCSAAAPAQSSQPSLDELLEITPPADAADDQPSDVDTEPVQLDPEAARRLSDEEAADVFKQAVMQMDDAAARLGDKKDAGLQTQRVQESILAKLDQVIAAAVRRRQGGSGSGSGSSQDQARQPDSGGTSVAQQQPGGQSTAGSSGGTQPNTGAFSPGQVERVGPDSRPIDESRSEWGNLPPRLRDELLQGLGERFSPVYRELTEAYYRRLAEQGQ